jgi:hypothetical protein
VAQVLIGDPRHERFDDGEQLSAAVQVGDTAHPVRFRAYGAPVATGIEPFLPISLLVAMRLHLPLQAARAISPRLHGQLGLLQQRFQAPDPELAVSDVRIAAGPPTEGRPAERVGVFFSGGADSFYTLLEHRTEITDLIYVHGFDIPIDNRWAHEAALANARGVARHFGKRLLHVETDLRQFSDRYALWAEHLCGPALAAVAHLLRPQLGRVLIAGEYFSTVERRASRIDLDPLWSTEAVEIVHVGHDITRVQKLGTIAHEEVVQRSLRVCWQNQEGRMNCCACSKCLRNMAALRLHGLLDRMTTFPVPLDLNKLAALELDREWPHQAESIAEMLRLVEARGTDPELARALRACYRQRRYRWPLAPVRRTREGLFRLVRRLRQRLRRGQPTGNQGG